MFFTETDDGIILRVRLTPNAAAAAVKGVFVDEKGTAYLKISVVSVPEKGRANRELIKLLSAKLKVAKSELELVNGEISHYKKILITGDRQNVLRQMEIWVKENRHDGADY